MEPFVGAVELFAFDFAPRGWVPCAGQQVPVNVNAALFSVIGTQFGGDGRTTFGLPDLRGKAPIEGLQYCIAIQGIMPPRG